MLTLLQNNSYGQTGHYGAEKAATQPAECVLQPGMTPIWQQGLCNAFALCCGQLSENIMNRSYPASSHTGGEA
ncbi:MAG: hypothetical protein F8N36_09270 [Desulfovibrio sp.]|nr:hypothetical protein [Desulfovibrio sp.]